jgi:hypothetical protein
MVDAKFDDVLNRNICESVEPILEMQSMKQPGETRIESWLTEQRGNARISLLTDKSISVGTHGMMCSAAG